MATRLGCQVRAKFIEGGFGGDLGIQFEAETDDERLLLRQFSQQLGSSLGKLEILGWGEGGPNPGTRHLRMFQVKQ